MAPYWFLFTYFAAGALLSMRRGTHPASQQRMFAELEYPMLLLGAVFVALMIGLRYNVGGDWTSYELIFSRTAYVDLQRALSAGDPGYQLLNWVANQLGAGLWLVNLICGLIFAWGFLKFARAQSNPWLAAVIAIPYLVIVVAMGYSRQAVGIGILMAGLVSFIRGGSIFRFAGYVAVAALFHRTAIVAFPLVAIAVERNRFVNIAMTVVLAYFFYDLFLAERVPGYVRSYVKAGYSSEGAFIRVAMSVVPALLFLAYRTHLGFTSIEARVWLNFSFAAIVLLALFAMSPSSTAVDRIALYVIPLQLAVLSRIPGSLVSGMLGALLVVLYSFAIQYTWLNFADHADEWVPYRIYPASADEEGPLYR